MTSALLPHFFRQYINSPIGQKRILTIARGAIQKNISGTSLLAFAIPVPSEGDQHAVVEILAVLDVRLANHESKKATLQDFFKASLNKLMTGDIRVADLEIDVKEVL